MSDFVKYLEMGAFHILDIGGLDHLLFTASMVVIYTFRSWLKVLKLLTAFTIGHGIALLIAVSDLVHVPTSIIEFLIPLSILIMAVLNMISARQDKKGAYSLVLIFGLIHGMAFAQGFESMFGWSPEFFVATIGFNLGVELGQLLFGLLMMSIVAFLVDVFGLSREKVRLFIFAVIITLAVQFLWKNKLW